MEVWKFYPADPRFEVSDQGRVRKVGQSPKQLKPWSNGRVMMTTTVSGIKKHYAVHCMVLETFIGPRPPGYTASHLNGISADNRKVNLVWESHSANCRRKEQHGTAQRGESHGCAKLTQAEVNAIRSSPFSSRTLAPIYGVSDVHIRRIRRGESWNGNKT